MPIHEEEGGVGEMEKCSSNIIILDPLAYFPSPGSMIVRERTQNLPNASECSVSATLLTNPS